MSQQHPRIEYTPPSDAAVRYVAQKFAQRADIPTDNGFVHGLTSFLKVAVRIQVKMANRAQVDTRTKSG
jgi:hypothetical protein